MCHRVLGALKVTGHSWGRARPLHPPPPHTHTHFTPPTPPRPPQRHLPGTKRVGRVSARPLAPSPVAPGLSGVWTRSSTRGCGSAPGTRELRGRQPRSHPPHPPSSTSAPLGRGGVSMERPRHWGSASAPGGSRQQPALPGERFLRGFIIHRRPEGEVPAPSQDTHPPSRAGLRGCAHHPPPLPPPQPPACVRSGPSCATCAPRVHGSSWQSRVLSFGLSTAACRTRGGGALQSPQSPPPDAFLHAPNPLVTSPGLSVAAARLTRSVPPPRPPAQELPLLAAQSPHSAVPLPHIPLQPHSFPFSGLQAEVPLFPYSELPPPRALSGHRGGPQPVRPPPTMWELCPESHRPGSAMGN